jgi:hypothetical protein
MVIDARFGNTCESKVFFTIVRSTSSTNTIGEGNETQGHWRKTNLFSHIFFVMENTQYP